jgi:hypothetical protein
MKKYYSFLLAVTAVTLFACSGISVANTEADPTANFSQYKTFGYYKIDASGDTITPTFNQRVRILKEAITGEMTKRGYTFKEENPDLYVNIGIVASNKVQTRETNWRTDGRYTYMGQRNYGWSAGEVEVGRYREGTVTLHVVDVAQNKMIWKGSANGVLPENAQKIPEMAASSMAELFKKFPVPAK